MKAYGYIKVSSTDKDEDKQLAAMKNLKIPDEDIYRDRQNGKAIDRPQYELLIKKIMPDDLLYILSLDQLGRNFKDIEKQWRILTKEKKADIAVISMSLMDTRYKKTLLGTFVADLVLQILSFVAQNERERIIRQAEGIAAAKAKGTHMGRPVKIMPDNFGEIVRQWERKQIPLSTVLEQCGSISASTFYLRLNEYRLKK